MLQVRTDYCFQVRTQNAEGHMIPATGQRGHITVDLLSIANTIPGGIKPDHLARCGDYETATGQGCGVVAAIRDLNARKRIEIVADEISVGVENLDKKVTIPAGPQDCKAASCKGNDIAGNIEAIIDLLPKKRRSWDISL